MKNKTIRAIMIILPFCALASIGLSAQEPEKQKKHDTALVIIDVQSFYFPKGAIPLAGSQEAVKQAKAVLDAFRRLNLPVVHVKHIPMRDGLAAKGEQWKIHPLVQPTPNEPVIIKHHVNSFRDTKLLSTLQAWGVKKLVMLGMQTHMCLEAAVRAAADLGFHVSLVHDACATRDISYGKTVIPANMVHAETLASLKDFYAQLVSSDKLISQMEAPQVSKQ